VQLHPRTPALYVLAAAHELAHGGMGAARGLLLRGLRLNAGSAELWREYVRLEMGFVEAVRRRWDVLGISLGGGDDDDGGGKGEGVDRAEEEAMGDAARRAIMGGAIVRQAIDSAGKGESFSFFLGARSNVVPRFVGDARTQFSHPSHIFILFFSLR
jgi:U3 small nucleolar RNA-associated protein 6